ncbi:hypothetical protein [Vibrio atypicus]|uniref:hypothetical protein n=1 Tax=Vibrio atypicus TaxID=558271 RepID=UPI00135B45C7|nr:hypothetical protein [Vibrio atypicus]
MRFLVGFLGAVLCFSTQANSSVVKISVEGKRVHWSNAIALGSNTWVPSLWQHVSHLTPTQSWLPGSWATATPTSVTLRSGSESAVLPARVIGLEYNTGSVIPLKGKVGGETSCTGSVQNGNHIQLKGQQCYLSHWLDTGNAITPFSFTRPIVELSDQQILSALDGKSAGVYFGSVALTSVYRYLFNQVETLHYLNHNVWFEIDYQPTAIYSAQVSGDYRLLPVYDFNRNQVSARTQFTVDVTGHFSQGVKVSLASHKLDYFLQGPALSKVPYSIDCLQCENQSLVKQGAVVYSDSVVGRGSQSHVQFNLQVYFEQQDLGEIEPGDYQDTFTLILQPEV